MTPTSKAARSLLALAGLASLLAPAASPALGPIAQPWRPTDDTIAGWDWSLPPGVRASPHGWVAYGHGEDLAVPFPPGNRVIPLYLRWRDLEPRDGEFDFSTAHARIARITDRSDLDPALFHYVCLSLGRTVADTPDAWCYLRETPTKENHLDQHSNEHSRSPSFRVFLVSSD